MGIGWRQAAAVNLSFLGVLPVVVRGNDRAGGIVQLQHGIGKWVSNTSTRQRGTYGPHYYGVVSQRATTNDETADQCVITAADQASRTDVTNLLRYRLKGEGRRR